MKLLKIFLLSFVISFSTAVAQSDDVLFEEGLNAFKASLYPVLVERCTKCHGDGKPAIGHAVSDPKIAYKNSLQLVHFADSSKSRFYDMVSKRHWLKFDPNSQGMSEAEILDGLSRWWEGGEKNVHEKYILKTDAVNLPVDLPTMMQGQWLSLVWNLEKSNSLYKGCDFKLDIQESSKQTEAFSGSYRVRNPRVRCLNSSFRFQGIFVSVSGQVSSSENIFASSDAVSAMNSEYSVFSDEKMILIQRQLSQPDSISILFKHIEKN